MKTKNELKSEFQYFISKIPYCINKIKNILNVKELSFQPDEIDILQNYYKENYLKHENEGLVFFKQIFKVYFGTAWLWHFGGEWYMEEHNTADQYGKICIQKYGGSNYSWVSLNIEDWLDAIEENVLEESLGKSFHKNINFFKSQPQYILAPKRDIQ